MMELEGLESIVLRVLGVRGVGLGFGAWGFRSQVLLELACQQRREILESTGIGRKNLHVRISPRRLVHRLLLAMAPVRV